MAFVVRTLLTLAVALPAMLCTEDVGNVYTKEFAVHVRGGRSVADRLAAKYGYTNHGEIGALEDHYLFSHPSISKRSTVHSVGEHTNLAYEPEVEWFEQQVARKRVKRNEYNIFNFSDPLWSRQWYLDGNATMNSTPVASMNIQKAWQMGYTGQGVVLTILDDGLEYNHTDIQPNYDPAASYDYVARKRDPMPDTSPHSEDTHGTRCAGEIVMQPNNGKCGVGVAFNASLGGIRMLDWRGVTDVMEASSLSYNPQHIDIYSVSWGPDDGGTTVEGPGTLAKSALEKGVTKGRGGKGSIFVWASGNGGLDDDDCNADGYAADIRTLVVSSTTDHQNKPFYSEHCSATLASTFSSGNSEQKKVSTTDLNNGCINSFTGTSASAPIAAGMCALALQANGNLTWRDMQYLVVVTAKRHQLTGQWTENGAGYQVSHWFGFGLMDAAAMVERAQSWETLPEQLTCTKIFNTKAGNRKRFFLRWNTVDFTSDLKVSRCREPTVHEDLNYLEHVQLTLTVSALRRGRVVVQLTSPLGTVSTLLSKRKRDFSRRGLVSWTLTSVHFWGENPLGVWSLRVGDGSDNRVRVSSAILTLHGTTSLPDSLRPEATSEVVNLERDLVQRAENAPSSVVRLAGLQTAGPSGGQVSQGALSRNRRGNTASSSSWDSSWWWSSSDWIVDDNCHTECLYGCKGPTAKDCYDCKHFKDRDTKECVETCPDGQYPPPELHIRCRRCNDKCQTCNGPSAQHCLTCAGDRYLSDGNGCVVHCGQGYFKDEESRSCQRCSPLCTACEGSAHQCTACVLGAVLRDSQCTMRCMESEYIDNSQCRSCHESCYSCRGPAATDCTACFSDKVHKDMQCVPASDCGEGYYISHGFDAYSRECLRCHSTCEECQGPSFKDCTSCQEGAFLVSGLCMLTCENGMYLDDSDGSCKPCGRGCTKCVDENHCIQCEAQQVLVTQGSSVVCSEWCPDGQYSMEGECFNCHGTCQTCNGGGIMDCTRCAQPSETSHRYLLEGACVGYCPQGYFKLEVGGDYTCAECDESCKRCTGQASNQCLECEDGLAYHEDTHTCTEEEGLRCEAENCDDCVLGNSNLCQRCLASFYLLNGKCSAECSDGYIPEPRSRQCQQCHPSCKTCSGTFDSCTSCDEDYFLYDALDNLCVTQCPSDMYPTQEKTCQLCHADCDTCTGPSDHDCSSCRYTGRFLDESSSSCVSECPSGQYGDDYNGVCGPCHPSCEECDGPGDHECTSCHDSFDKINGLCQSSCSDKMYRDDNGNCQSCHSSCVTCKGGSATDCLSCNYYNFLDNQNRCVTDCPVSFYPDYESNLCRQCHSSCSTCLGSNAEDCIECSPSTYMLLRNGQLCVETCPEGFYESEELGFRDCRQCSIECLDCTSSYLNCISCREGTFLYQQRCFSTCPSGYDEDARTKHCVQRDRLCPLFCVECDDWGDCTQCEANYVEYFGECVKESEMACRLNEYIASFDENNEPRCEQCHLSCATCLGPDAQDCVSCADSLHFRGSRCVTDCNAGTYLDSLLSECLECHPTCVTCVAGSPADCTSCQDGMHLDGQSQGLCLFECAEGKYMDDNGQCQNCWDENNCTACIGPNVSDCLACRLGTYKLESGECVADCPEGTYHYLLEDSLEGNECRACHSSCVTCNSGEANGCTSCPEGMAMLVGQCLWECEDGYYTDEDHRCQRCHSTCETCTGPSNTSCLTCPVGQFIQNQECVSKCEPAHFITTVVVPMCMQCDPSCQECSDNGPFDCISCYDNYELADGVCYNRCGTGRYYNKKKQTCHLCSPECLNCFGPAADQCIDCHKDMWLEKVDHNSTRCIPCCQNKGDETDCCKSCDPTLTKCTKSYVRSGHGHSKANHVGTIVFSCIAVIIVFFVIFGLLQARSHGKLCWNRNYTHVPAYSYSAKDKYVTLGKPTDDYYEEDIYGEVSDDDEEDIEEPDTFQTGGALSRSVDKNGFIDHL
ncbi:proprotein convertase subtilisin/kexin type 5-like [Diadema setosum]|uniref:proprotein convertase subtilisin/kexin type 5-like n=1 Tax=Diadema setosum TaxID=31175 RepID=UPI003B3B36C1